MIIKKIYLIISNNEDLLLFISINSSFPFHDPKNGR